MKNNCNSYEKPKKCFYILSCEKGLPSAMFFSREKLTTFPDFANHILGKVTTNNL